MYGRGYSALSASIDPRRQLLPGLGKHIGGVSRRVISKRVRPGAQSTEETFDGVGCSSSIVGGNVLTCSWKVSSALPCEESTSETASCVALESLYMYSVRCITHDFNPHRVLAKLRRTTICLPQSLTRANLLTADQRVISCLPHSSPASAPS